MEVIPIVLRYVFSFFIFHIFKWYNQEGVWLTSVEMKNTLPSFKYGFVRKIAYARDLYGLFALESILSEGKNFLRWHKALITTLTASRFYLGLNATLVIQWKQHYY